MTDVQSPARAEFLDRHGDPDSPLAPVLGRVGTYRAQEALSFQVVEAMARKVRELAGGPATGAPFAFAITTGDSTDNSQENELESYVALLEGGREVVPDSGDRERYEGVGALDAYDERYWHPDGTPPGAEVDLPRRRNGLPVVPGLLDACRAPFTATGLGMPWYAVYGNHDALFGGTLPAVGPLAGRAVGSQKPTGLSPDADVLELLSGNETSPSVGEWGIVGGTVRTVTADERRRPVSRAEWIGAHLRPGGQPFGHGYDEDAMAAARAYYAFDAGVVRCVVLDSVNANGGWQGSFSAEQLAWLEGELVAGHRFFVDESGETVTTDAEDRLFVLFSHHTLETLINDFSPLGERRILGTEFEAFLARFPNVVAWFNGHTHLHAVDPIGGAPDGRGGFWQVTTASHADWPQQGRVVELALDEASGDLILVTAAIDHAGLSDPRAGELSDPLALAGWSRELALNAWQGRPDAALAALSEAGDAEPIGRGQRADRNVVLVLPAPFPLLREFAREAGRAVRA